MPMSGPAIMLFNGLFRQLDAVLGPADNELLRITADQVLSPEGASLIQPDGFSLGGKRPVPIRKTP